MVQVEFEIDGYKIHVFSRQPESETPTLAVITLWKKTEIRGYIHFYPDDIVLPNPALDAEPLKRIRLRLHMYQFPIIVEILRTEKPLYIEYSEPPPVAVLRSGREPIGEEEKLFHPK